MFEPAAADGGRASFYLTWQDPDFEPAAPAYWYARVLEVPTPRWSKLLCERLDQCEGYPDADRMIQERARSSPIWYEPVARAFVSGWSPAAGACKHLASYVIVRSRQGRRGERPCRWIESPAPWCGAL